MEEWYAFLLPPCPWIPHFCVSVSALIINTTRDGFIYDGSVGKESACNAREPQERQVRSLGQEDPSPAEGNGNPLQCSCLGNPMDGGAWWATVHGVAKSETRLSTHAATAREGSPRVARVENFSPSYSCFYSAFSWLLPYQCITYLLYSLQL